MFDEMCECCPYYHKSKEDGYLNEEWCNLELIVQGLNKANPKMGKYIAMLSPSMKWCDCLSDFEKDYVDQLLMINNLRPIFGDWEKMEE